VFGDLEYESLTTVSELIYSLKNELNAFRKAAQNHELRPLPGETVSSNWYISQAAVSDSYVNDVHRKKTRHKVFVSQISLGD